VIEADWVHEPHIYALYLADATHPRTRIGALPDALPMTEILPEVGWINARLMEYDTIEAALPELAETTLQGEQLEAIRPWAMWMQGLQEAWTHHV